MRELCSKKIIPELLNFGDENSIVQIDESKFLKLKYNRGHIRGNLTQRLWTFGLFDTLTRRAYIWIVPNRKQRTIFPIIKSVVLKILIF